jgi:hypothetical protein
MIAKTSEIKKWKVREKTNVTKPFLKILSLYLDWQGKKKMRQETNYHF